MCKSQNLTKTQQWQDAVDLIDPFYGSSENLKELLSSAPNKTLRQWLAEQIAANEALARQFAAIRTCDRCV